MGRIYHAKVEEKKAAVAIFISDKVNFQTKSSTRNNNNKIPSNKRKSLHNNKRL